MKYKYILFFILWATTLAACSQNKENKATINSRRMEKRGNDALDSDDYNKAIEWFIKRNRNTCYRCTCYASQL